MSTDIKEVVKEKYGQAASRVLSGRSGCCGSGSALASSCDPITSKLYNQDEAAAVAEAIGKHITTRSASEIAILVRTNAATARFERELQAAGIPYTVRGTARFMQRPEVKRAVSLLRVAAKHSSDQPVADRVAAALEPMGFTSEPPLGQAQREEWESLAALVGLARGHDTLEALIADLDERAETDDAPVADAVTLASLHSAKGLEWDVVFLPELYEGGLPLRYQGELVDVEEERRLFYVAVTRAKNELYLSYPLMRAGYGNTGLTMQQPSRFLEEIPTPRTNMAMEPIWASKQSSFWPLISSARTLSRPTTSMSPLV